MEERQPTPPLNESKGNIQAVLAYIPFLFIAAMLQRPNDDQLVFHSKNGAGLTLLFIASSFVSAWVHAGIGSLLMFAYFIPTVLGAYHGYKNQKWSIPWISGWSQNIPLEKWFSSSQDPSDNQSKGS